ncbi:MAG: F0F1 ATP synthase subunit B [Acidobacteriota bacterium]|jgi:F-type H+-transporting ATPase subunit b|nr:F0F1 ATP synthase subunit B [Acidobacteriota bacterium]
MDNPLVQVEPGLAIWTIVTFLVLLWLLAKFAWRPLLRALDARQDAIRKSLEDAEAARRAAEEANKNSEQILQKARSEAEAIVAASRSEAEKLREEIRQHARSDAEAIVKDARGQIDLETSRALRQIRSEIADMSVGIAEKLIRRNCSSEANIDLIEETLKQIEQNTPRPS